MAAGVADGVQLAEEIARGNGAGTALVVEANLVRHGMIAEEDRQLVIALACLPGSIKQLGMADVAPAVAPDLAARRAAQNLLVGRDPLDAMLGQQWNKRLADRALAGPHSPGSGPKPRLMAFHGPANVKLGVVGIAFAIAGQGNVGHGLACQLLVQQQGQDGVIVRGRGQLDLSAVGQRPVQGDDSCNELELLIEQPLLLILGVMAALGLELGELGVFLEQQGMEPRQVRPDLKVAQVSRTEPCERRLRRVLPRRRAACKARDTASGGESSSRRGP